MPKIREEYEIDKVCVNSVRYKPSEKGGKLEGMTVYVPKKILPVKPPASIHVTLDIPNE